MVGHGSYHVGCFTGYLIPTISCSLSQPNSICKTLELLPWI